MKQSFVLSGVLTLTPVAAHADIAGFGDFSQYTLNQADAGSAPVIGSNSIQLTNQATGERRSLFHNTPQSVSQFEASFVYRAGGGPLGRIGGAFVLQNDAAGPHALGNRTAGSDLAYAGIGSSVAVSLEIDHNTSSYSGFYNGGIIGGGASVTDPVQLLSGNSVRVDVSYNGSLLRETLTDTTTGAQFERSYLENIPNLLGGPTAYVGFTAATGGNFVTGDQFFSDFSFTSVPEPSSAAVALGISMLGLRRRRE